MHAACTTDPRASHERVRREPERTVLYQVLDGHLGHSLACADAEGSGLPRFVRRELQAFLDCGIPERGFARLRCPDCRHETVVAFSCKGRGFCPSCGGRRMAETAAHVVDHVLPGEVPYRQWVLTVDHRLRYQMAHDGDLCSAVLREFIRSVFNDLRRRARRVGVRRPQPGAVTCIQRFNSNLATNVHFHTLVPDGVFTADHHGTAVFHPLAPPTLADLERVARTVRRRVSRLLRRLGRLPTEDGADEEPDPLSLDQPVLAHCLAASVTGLVAVGPRAGRPLDRDSLSVADANQTDANPWCAQVDGFNLHAGVTVKAGDRDRLEHICRYIARPAIAQDRLTLTVDGRVAYRLKRPWRDRSTRGPQPQVLAEAPRREGPPARRGGRPTTSVPIPTVEVATRNALDRPIRRGLRSTASGTHGPEEGETVGQVVEILPKTLFAGDFVQGPEQAVDVGEFNNVVIQTWLSETLTSTEQVDITIEQSVVNEDDAYDTSNTVEVVTYSGAGTTTGTQLINTVSAGMARYFRVRLARTNYTGTMTARVVLVLRRET